MLSILPSLLLPLAVAPGRQDVPQGPPIVRILRTDDPPKIDGVLDDPVWRVAPEIGPLTQVDPLVGVPVSERTEVRLAYDADFLYIALACFDSEPDKIIGTQGDRDANLDPDDRVEIIIDTFLDRRNAFFFQIGPAGSLGDGLITKNGGSFNKPWDGIWYGQAKVTGQGWMAELALPFKTLTFRPGLDTWGFNVNRWIKRKNETARWAGARRDVSFFNISEAGRVTGIEGIRQGIGLDLVPFFVGDWENDSLEGERHVFGDFGLDAFYRLTSNLTASVTVNTDFAETEVDARQVNLTRFPLFFPERRDFFLENAGLFEFADGSTDALPFFSRRIGLVQGSEVSIQAGAKITGRAGKYNIGFLDVQTGDTRIEGSGEVEGDNFFVGRVSRNVGEQSTLGAIVTRGNPGGPEDNLLYGIDGNFNTTSFLGDKRLQAKAWFLQTDSESSDPLVDVSDDDLAYGAQVLYPNDIWRWGLRFFEIQENFNPALGFLPRNDIRSYSGELTYRPRINETIRQLEFQAELDVVTGTDGDLQTAVFEFQPFGVYWQREDELRLELEAIHEELIEDFEIADGVVIPVGEYDFARARLEFESALRRPTSLSLDVDVGEFFDGHRSSVQAEVSWRPSSLFNTSLEYQWNDVSLPGGDFTTGLSRARFDFAFNPELSWQNFIQWDSLSDSIGINSRWRWIPVPGREVFLVFNQTLDEDDGSFQTRFQGVSFKVSYTFRF